MSINNANLVKTISQSNVLIMCKILGEASKKSFFLFGLAFIPPPLSQWPKNFFAAFLKARGFFDFKIDWRVDLARGMVGSCRDQRNHQPQPKRQTQNLQHSIEKYFYSSFYLFFAKKKSIQHYINNLILKMVKKKYCKKS